MRTFSTTAAVAILLAGCAPDDQRAPAQSEERPVEPATAALNSPSAFPKTDGTIPTKSGNLRVERLAALEEPWGMAFLPDGRLLITEKPGRLRIFSDGKLSAPVGGVPTVVYFM